MSEIPQYVLVDINVLPEVFEKVLHAKLLLAKGIAKSSADACRLAEVSRGAFYKYKDSVFLQDFERHRTNRKPFILSCRMNREYYHPYCLNSYAPKNGANILTVNQNIPVDMVAVVTVSFRLEAFWQNRSKREFEQFFWINSERCGA